MAMGSPASPRNVGAVQPPRAARLLHTRRTLSKPASSSYRRFLVLCSFATLVVRLPLLGITLFAFPAAGRRVVARSALLAYTLLAPVRAYIDRMLGSSLSHTTRSRDACRACILLVARISDVARSRRQNPSDYNVCFLRAVANRAR